MFIIDIVHYWLVFIAWMHSNELAYMNRDMTKPTKWVCAQLKTQISLGIRPVWSESSLSAWRKLGSLATHWAHSAHADLSLRWAYSHFVGFVMSWLIYRPQQLFYNTLQWLSDNTNQVLQDSKIDVFGRQKKCCKYAKIEQCKSNQTGRQGRLCFLCPPPPTLKILVDHIAFWRVRLSVHPWMCDTFLYASSYLGTVHTNVLKFHSHGFFM